MRVSARKGAVIGAVGFALVLSACGGGDDEGGGDEGGGGEAAGPAGSVVIGGCQPQNLLIPANTNETCGGNPLDWIFAKLVSYDPDTAEPSNEIAESIESEDNITWTITLKDGWTFHDGTPVTAQSFVDAWNFGAYGPNAYLSSYFFEPIEGFAEVQGEDANGDEAITPDEAPVTEMSGLEVVDDKTFTDQADRTAVVVPDAARLHGVRAAARVLLRGPRRIRSASRSGPAPSWSPSTPRTPRSS